MKKNVIILLSLMILSLPAVGLAAAFVPPAIPLVIGVPVDVLVNNLLGTALTVLWSIAAFFAIVMFTIAGFKFFTSQGDPNRVAEARQAVIWGTAGAVVVILAWSILAVVKAQLGV